MTDVQDKAGPRQDETIPQPEPVVGPPSLCQRRFGLILTGICLAGLVIRLLIVAEYVASNPFSTGPRVDAKVYWQWADGIAHGKLIQDQPFFSAPLYPYALGIIRALGGTLATVYITQSLLDILTAFLLARVCRRRFGAGAGLLAGALFLALQEPASLSLRVLTCSLQLFLLVLTWGRLVAVQDRPTWARRVAAGLVTGLLCLSYPPAILLIPAVALWLFWQSARRWTDLVPAAATAAIACLVIAPATLHNWYVSRSFFLIQSATAINLRQGNAPGADGTYIPIPGTTTDREGLFEDAARQYTLSVGRTGTWGEMDRFYRDQVVDFWRSDWPGALRLAARKAYWFLTGRIYGDIYVPALEIASGFADRLRLAPIQTAWLMGPALIAVIAMLRRPIRYAPELLMFAIPFLLVVVFWYTPRYRLPAVPVIVGGSAWVLSRAASWRMHPAFSTATVVALALGVLLGPLNRAFGFDTADKMESWYEVSAGVRFEEQGGVSQAREHYERALQLRPDDPNAMARLGRLAFQEGRTDEAVRLFQSAVQAEPMVARWHANLAKALANLGRVDQAEISFNRALELDPGLVSVHSELARIHVRRDELDKAIAEWEAALKTDPTFVEAYVGLAACYERIGRMEDALAQYQTALKVAPRNAAVRISLSEFYIRRDRLEDGERVIKEGLAAAPEDMALLTSLAWFYATAPRADLRRGDEAVRMAERACRVSRRQNPRDLDTLAAAYAEAGRFDDAVATIQECIRLVQRQGPQQLLPALQHRLDLYQSGRPFHWSG